MESWCPEARDQVGRSSAAKVRTNIADAASGKVAQQKNSIGSETPSFPGGAVADLESQSEWRVWLRLESLRLNPEIMREGRAGDKCKRQRTETEDHKASYVIGCKQGWGKDRGLSSPVGDTAIAAAGGRPGHGSNASLLLLLFTLLLLPSPAFAHEGTGLAGGFIAGFLHPLLGLDHMLAMVAVGLWGAFLGRPLIVLLPIVFPAMMTAGAGIGMLALSFPLVEVGIALSVVTLGTAIMFAARAPVAVAAAIVAAFALFHGYAHGTELPVAADPVGYSAGFVLCTGLLHVAGIGLGLLKSTSVGTLVLRGGGGLIALAGLWFSYLALA